MAEEVGENYNPETEVEIGNFKIVDLKPEEEQTKESATELFKARTKVYFWDKESNEWKERGVGNVLVIRNEDDQKIRVVHCQEQTFKIRVLFYAFGEKLCVLKQMETVKNSYCFSCIDYSEDLKKPTLRQVGIRFTNEEDYKKFAEQVDEARKHNNSLEFFKNLVD